MIRDFIKMRDVAALIARPRRFGKTLNMTMLREFFDISRDSRDLFKGLAIMDTEYADQINYGVQRVAKESIFSQFNNPQVYTVIDREYAPYFGLNESETRTLLEAYGYELSEDVRRMYDGYQIGGTGIFGIHLTNWRPEVKSGSMRPWILRLRRGTVCTAYGGCW